MIDILKVNRVLSELVDFKLAAWILKGGVMEPQISLTTTGDTLGVYQPHVHCHKKLLVYLPPPGLH